MMDFEKLSLKTFDDAYKGNIDQVITTVEEHSSLLKEVDVVSYYLIFG